MDLRAVLLPGNAHSIVNLAGVPSTKQMTRLVHCLQMLELDVKEVRVVAVEDIRKVERHQIHSFRSSSTQVQLNLRRHSVCYAF